MKKFLTYLVLIALMTPCTLFPVAFADTDVKPGNLRNVKKIRGENLVVIENNRKFGLNEKTSGKVLLPPIYNKIGKFKYENQNIILAEHPYHKVFYSPDGIYDDFIRRYYDSNASVKFENYPSEASVIYNTNPNDGKTKKSYGIITLKDGMLYVTDAVFSKVSIPDENSFIAKNLNITFAPLNQIFVYSNSPYYSVSLKNYFFTGFEKFSHYGENLTEKAKINEEIYVKDGILHSKYKNITFSNDEVYPVADKTNIQLSQNHPLLTFSPEFRQNSQRLASVEEFYDFIEKYYNVELVNYPKNFVLYNDNTAEVVRGGMLTVLKAPMFYPMCENSLLNKLTGLKLSFASQDAFIAENFGKYGIIDRNENAVADFKYDKLQPLYCNVTEKARINPKTGKLVLEFQNIDFRDGLFIAYLTEYDKEKNTRDRLKYLINLKEGTSLSLGNAKYGEKAALNPVTNKLKDIKKAEMRAKDGKEFANDIKTGFMQSLLGMVYLPFILLGPPFWGVYGEINYFNK